MIDDKFSSVFSLVVPKDFGPAEWMFPSGLSGVNGMPEIMWNYKFIQALRSIKSFPLWSVHQKPARGVKEACLSPENFHFQVLRSAFLYTI